MQELVQFFLLKINMFSGRKKLTV